MEFEKWLQSRLTAHGYPVGPIDGEISENTIKALKAFEQANGLRIDGAADPIVVQALRASASAVAPKVMTEIPNRDVAPVREEFQASKTIWPRQAECITYYGPLGQNQTQIEVPFDMYLAWSKSTRLKRMTLHSRVAESALQVLQKVGALYSAAERQALGVDLFGGSLNVRKMRGGNSYSMHSWGIAIDFDPARNQLNAHRPNARLSHPDAVAFWVAWESAGWLSLGRARDFDWMHVQAARL